MDVKRIEAIVNGRVQGVSFRYYTQQAANELHLTGWVVNRRDGSVQTVAEGPEDTLTHFVAFLYRGSPMARVNNVTVTWAEATGEFVRFAIRWF